MKLRPYQQKAKDKLFLYFEKQGGNPLIVLPTGTGKSFVIADICKEVCDMDRGARIIVATHSQELVAQNYAEYIGYHPDGDAGVYSAGLNRKQVGRSVTFGGIQSLVNAAFDFQHIDILIVDEAHTIPHGEEGRWHQFINDLNLCNPFLKVVGLTATDYRMKSGKLTKGKGKMFDTVVYEYNVGDAVKDGYLCEITNKDDETGEEIELEAYIDASGVGTSGGEYIEKQLQIAVDQEPITKACVKEIVKFGKHRGSWLVFCSGVDHANHVRDEIRSYGITCESVSGKTKKGERARILADFKSGKIQCVTNNNVLTTGFNHPGCDLLAIMRPTKSPGLWIQILGRVMRAIYASGFDLSSIEGRLEAIFASGKKNGLVLDFTNNTTEFGPIDKINVDKKEKETAGDAPIKQCPECFETVFAGCRHCPECGYEFPPNELAISKKTNKDALLSSQVTVQTAAVTNVSYYRHLKEGKPDSLRVEYLCGFNVHKTYVCLGHSGGARTRACEFWSQATSLHDKRAPQNTSEALDRLGELKPAKRILYKKSGKYTEIVGIEY